MKQIIANLLLIFMAVGAIDCGYSVVKFVRWAVSEIRERKQDGGAE